MDVYGDRARFAQYAALGKGFKKYGKGVMVTNTVSLTVNFMLVTYFSSISAGFSGGYEDPALLLIRLQTNIILIVCFFIPRLMIMVSFLRVLKGVSKNPPDGSQKLRTLFICYIISLFLIVILTVAVIVARSIVAADLKSTLGSMPGTEQMTDQVFGRLLNQDKFIYLGSFFHSLFYLAIVKLWQKWGEGLDPEYRFYPSWGRNPTSIAVLTIGAVLYVIIDLAYLVLLNIGYPTQSYMLELVAIFVSGFGRMQIGTLLIESNYPGRQNEWSQPENSLENNVSGIPGSSSSQSSIEGKGGDREDLKETVSCKLCGRQITNDSIFCPNCGSTLK